MSFLSIGARSLARLPAVAARTATSVSDDGALAAVRATLGPGVSDDLVRDAARMNLAHLIEGEVVDEVIEGLHLARQPGRIGAFDVVRLNSSRKPTNDLPVPGRTWLAEVSAPGLRSKQSVMFPPDWSVADVVDGARHIRSGSIGLPRARNGRDTFVHEGRWRGVDMRVVWDRTDDRITSIFPRRPNQAALG